MPSARDPAISSMRGPSAPMMQGGGMGVLSLSWQLTWNTRPLWCAASPRRHFLGAPWRVVFGRVDFVGSLGWPRDSINLQKTTDYALEIAKLCKKADKQLVMGGGVSIESIDAIRQVQAIRLDRFETRKVVFDAGKALALDIEEGLVDAVHFELLWLLNKRDYYNGIGNEDAKRIGMLEARWEELKSWHKEGKNKK